MHRRKVGCCGHGCDYSFADSTLVVTAIQPADPLQVRNGTGSALCNSHDPEIRQDVTNRNINLCRTSFTPRGHRACDVPGLAPELASLLDPLPGVLGDAATALTFEHLAALLLRPLQSAIGGQTRDL